MPIGNWKSTIGNSKREIEMTTDNIFSGLKVVDFSSFVAAPGAAVILSDFGADVIKVEPPSGDTWRIGNHIPPQPMAKDPYQFHLTNRNKRGMALDLKSPGAQPILEKLVKWADVFIVNTPHPARKTTEARIRGRRAVEPASDLCGSHRFWRQGA